MGIFFDELLIFICYAFIRQVFSHSFHVEFERVHALPSVIVIPHSLNIKRVNHLKTSVAHFQYIYVPESGSVRLASGLMWRVEPICHVLSTEYGVQISVSGYYAFKRCRAIFKVIKFPNGGW